MKHTYFYTTLEWRARGTYYDEHGKGVPLYGEVSTIKNENQWTLSGFMEVRTQIPMRFTNEYIIKETNDKTTLSWTSYNPALGTLAGTFEIIGDCMISTYQSEDGRYTGTETLFWKDDFTYYNVGVAFCEGKKMSSWTATLKGRKSKK
ncbi:MAG: hypothetical protein Q4F05_19525 [bacterium]|nr:hypothetical protein [bacterium]